MNIPRAVEPVGDRCANCGVRGEKIGRARSGGSARRRSARRSPIFARNWYASWDHRAAVRGTRRTNQRPNKSDSRGEPRRHVGEKIGRYARARPRRHRGDDTGAYRPISRGETGIRSRSGSDAETRPYSNPRRPTIGLQMGEKNRDRRPRCERGFQRETWFQVKVDLNEIWPRDKREDSAFSFYFFFSPLLPPLLPLSAPVTPATSNRHKSEGAIRVQLRESVKIRKRESLQMAEATLVFRPGFVAAVHIYPR